MTAEEAIRHLKYLRTGMAVEALSMLASNPERSQESRARALALNLAIESIERYGIPVQQEQRVAILSDPRSQSAGRG